MTGVFVTLLKERRNQQREEIGTELESEMKYKTEPLISSQKYSKTRQITLSAEKYTRLNSSICHKGHRFHWESAADFL